MLKFKVTIQARWKVDREEKEMFDGFMSGWSVWIRFAYKRVLEGKTRNKKELQNTKNVGSALLIARRGFGFSEKISKNYKRFLEKVGESFQCESGRVFELTDGRNCGTGGSKEKHYVYNPWRVLEVAVLTAFFPEGDKLQKLVRRGSCVERKIVSVEMGRARERCEVMLPEAGPMDAQIPPAGAGHPEQRRITNTPAPNCILMQFG